MTKIGPPRRLVPWRIVFALVAVTGFVLLANAASTAVLDLLTIELTPRNEPMVHRLIMASAALYALLMALPFVPGVEIGIGLLATVGPGIAGLVYACTVLGLSISFLVGYAMPEASLRRGARLVRLNRLDGLLERLQPLSRDERVALLVDRAPARAVSFLVRHRYLALAVALNLPGNAVIGGGGGITLLAGLSRLYSLPAFLVTVMIAVAPVPLAVAILGRSVLG